MKKMFLLLTIFSLTVPMLGCSDKKKEDVKPPAADGTKPDTTKPDAPKP